MADVAFASDDDDDDEPLFLLLFRFGLDEPIVVLLCCLSGLLLLLVCLLPPLTTIGFDSKLLLLWLLWLLFRFIDWLIDCFHAWMGGVIDRLISCFFDGRIPIGSVNNKHRYGIGAGKNSNRTRISKRVHNNNKIIIILCAVTALYYSRAGRVLVTGTENDQISNNSKIILAARRGFQRRPKILFF